MLVIMNMIMLIQFTAVSRRVSVIFMIIGVTGSYLFYLVIIYIVMIVFMSIIVWTVWGDKLVYFRSLNYAMVYTLAMFDMKTMYIGTDFTSSNQYGVSSVWALVVILMLSVVF